MRIYAVVFALTVFILLYCTVRASSYKKQIAATVQRVLLWAVLAVFSCIVLLYTKNPFICLIVYSIYFICINWMLYFLLTFAAQYIGYEGKSKIFKNSLLCLLLADTVSLFLNSWTGHAFGCRQILLGGKEIYYTFEPYFFYNVHLAIAYFMMALVLICLIFRSYRAPSFYRRKYLMVLFSILVIALLDAVYLFVSSGIDVAILFYALAGISIYYFALIYSPKEPLYRTLADVVHNMTDAMFVLDMEDICIYTNESAQQLFHIHNGERLAPGNALLSRCIQIKEAEEKDKKEGIATEQTVLSEGREYHLRMQFKRLEDKKGRYTGSFFIVQDHTEAIRKTREEFYRTSHDSLTGFYNREYFYVQSKKCLREHPLEQYLMICVDIRNFEMATALFGRRMGNELLIQAARLLREYMRPEDVYGRFSGGKFVILMKQSEFKEQSFLTIWEEQEYPDKGSRYPFNVYVGIYKIDSPFIPTSVMCDRAIQAMSTIREGGRIAYYTNELHETVLREQELQGEMMSALEKGEFRVCLQPQVSKSGEITGARSSIYWMHPEKGTILPEEFFPIFEKSGMAAKLNLYEWDFICRKLSEWNRSRKDFIISVHISSKDVYFLDIYKVFKELTAKYGVSPRNLKLELSQDTHMMDMGYQLDLVKRLREAGFAVELDRLGEAYASRAVYKESGSRKTDTDVQRAMEVTEFEKRYM